MSPKAFYKTGLLLTAVIIIIIGGLILKRGYTKEREYQKRRAAEFNSLITEYRTLREELANRGAKKKNLLEDINSIITITGLKEKLRTLKQNPPKETLSGTLEEAELLMERLTMNELANILYWAQQKHLSINRINIKRAFDAPETLNVTFYFTVLSEK